MPNITTKLGYSFHSDKDVSVGDYILVPEPKVDEVTIDEDVVRFLAVMYSNGLEWRNDIVGRFDIGAVQTELPPEILNLNIDLLKIYVEVIFNTSSQIISHVSGSSDSKSSNYPEWWTYSKHRGVAEGNQHILLRLGIKSRVTFVRQKNKWATKVTGYTYVMELRKYLKGITNPTILNSWKNILPRIDESKLVECSKPVSDRVSKVTAFKPISRRW